MKTNPDIHDRLMLEAVARLTAVVFADKPEWTDIVITRVDGGVSVRVHSDGELHPPT